MQERAFRIVWRLAAFTMVALSPLRSATAQEQAGSWYVMGGAAAVHQDGLSGESSQTYVGAPGGTSWGWWVAGGTFRSSRVSIEGEFAATGTMRATERSRYGYTYHEERRDFFLGANVRFHVGSLPSVHIEPVGGIGLVFHQSWGQDDQYRDWLSPPVVVRSPRQKHATRIDVGFSGGVDVRIGGRRVAVVPSFRVRWHGWGEGLRWLYPGGYPTWTITGRVGVRIDL